MFVGEKIVFIRHAEINTSLCIVFLSMCVLKNCIFHAEVVQCNLHLCVCGADKVHDFVIVDSDSKTQQDVSSHLNMIDNHRSPLRKMSVLICAFGSLS